METGASALPKHDSTNGGTFWSLGAETLRPLPRAISVAVALVPVAYLMGVFEQLLLGPVRPQKLAFLVANRAQALELAGEGDQELVPSIRAADPGDALVEDAAIEVAVDGRFDAATKIAVGVTETVRIDMEEALEVVGKSPIEHCALGMAPTIDLATRGYSRFSVCASDRTGASLTRVIQARTVQGPG